MSDMFFRTLSLFPFLQRDEEERIIGASDAAQQAVTGDGGYFVHPWDVHQNFFHLLSSSVGAFERSGIRQRQIRIEIALVLFRQKAHRDSLPAPSAPTQDHPKQTHPPDASPHHH